MVLISELTLCKSKDKTLHEYLIKAISRIILYSVSHFASGRLNWIISVMAAEVFLICVYIYIYVYLYAHNTCNNDRFAVDYILCMCTVMSNELEIYGFHYFHIV